MERRDHAAPGAPGAPTGASEAAPPEAPGGAGGLECRAAGARAAGARAGRLARARAGGHLHGAPLRLAAAGLLAALDQATKAAALAGLPPGGSVPLLPFLSLTPGRNPGVAFGGLAGLGAPALLALTGAITLGFAAALAGAGRAPGERRVGLAAVVGGALGNWIDRAARGGEVVDFVHLHAGGLSFPLFNAADALLTLGAGCFVLEWLRAGRARRNEKGAGDPGPAV